jgi:hypothetical protein
MRNDHIYARESLYLAGTSIKRTILRVIPAELTPSPRHLHSEPARHLRLVVAMRENSVFFDDSAT